MELDNSLLVAQSITKRYGDNVVLDDLSLRVRRGERCGLIGKNGSGKTTLLRILGGLIPRYRGIVEIGAVNGRRAKVGALIQNPALFPNMTARENMKTQTILLGLSNPRKTHELLEMVGLAEHAQKQVRHFSLGMTQRLRLAVALLDDPDILLLDEPVNGLDPEGIAEFRQLVEFLNRKTGLATLISSHILGELEQTATRFFILSGGKIARDISADELEHSGQSLEQLYLYYAKGGN